MTEERFKQLAGYVSSDDWDKLINFTAERILRRLAGAGLFDTAEPEQLKQAHELVGTALVDFVNVALTSVAEGEANS
jgi:hypothetical protein